MGEAAQENIPSLAEWSLPPTKEQPAQNVISVASSHDDKPIYPVPLEAAMEKPDEVPIEKAGETPASVTAGDAPFLENTNQIPTSEEITDVSFEGKPDDVHSESPQEEPSDEQEDTEVNPEIKIETAPADFRFPTTNQTRHCFTRYIEYHRCINAKGEDTPECNKFAKYYRSLCPSEWIERWNEQRENGTFPGPL